MAEEGKSSVQPDSPEEDAKAKSESRRWVITTVIALLLGIPTAFAGYEALFQESPSTVPQIQQSHADFTKLSYADKLDICVPYINSKIDKWRNIWLTALNIQGWHDPRMNVASAVGDQNASGQAIVNNYTVILNYATKIAPTDEGKNLLSCLVSPDIIPRTSDLPSDPEKIIDKQVGSGNTATREPLAVAAESPIYLQGEFADFKVSGSASKVIAVLYAVGEQAQGVDGREMGFSVMKGHQDESNIWALTVDVVPGDPAWLDFDGLRVFTGS